MTLEGRTAVVTGASRGIGEAIARALDARGARTLLVARGADRLRAIAGELRRAEPCAADLAQAAGAENVADAAGRAFGTPDILVNNAGVFAIGPIETTDDATLDTLLALNAAAPFRLVRAFLPGMIARGSGDIVTIGSVADRKVFPGSVAYAMSKYASRALHEAVVAEGRGHGVRATLVSPGPVDTAIWDPYDPDHTRGLTPRAKMLRPEHVVDAVLWALSRPRSVTIDELRLTPG